MVKNSLPGKIPTESPGHMTCPVHVAHGTLSTGLPQGTNQKHVRWPRCSALLPLQYVGWFHTGILVPELNLYDSYISTAV